MFHLDVLTFAKKVDGSHVWTVCISSASSGLLHTLSVGRCYDLNASVWNWPLWSSSEYPLRCLLPVLIFASLRNCCLEKVCFSAVHMCNFGSSFWSLRLKVYSYESCFPSQNLYSDLSIKYGCHSQAQISRCDGGMFMSFKIPVCRTLPVKNDLLKTRNS